MNKSVETIDVGTGDVFADLGFQDSGERKLRAQLAMRINELLQERKLAPAKVAALFGVPQPHISELKNYKLSRFSSERLKPFSIYEWSEKTRQVSGSMSL